MTRAEADEIAQLLNDRNRLVRRYTGQQVLADADNYEYESRDGHVVACVELKRVQWYQWEIRHLSVREDSEGKGLAFTVYSRAEAAALQRGAGVLQCTIRQGNEDSEKFFRRQGFTRVGAFYYQTTNNPTLAETKALRGPTRDNRNLVGGGLLRSGFHPESA